MFSVIGLSLIFAGSSNLFGERCFWWSGISLRSHQLMKSFLVNAIFLGMPENEIYEEIQKIVEEIQKIFEEIQKIFEEIQKIFEEMQKTYEEMQRTEVSCVSSVGQAVAAWLEALAPVQGIQWSGPKGRADQQGYTWVWIQIRFLPFPVFSFIFLKHLMATSF